MRMAKRIDELPPYLFVGISKKIAEKQAKGEDVINLAVGDPDIPTPRHIIERLCQAAQDPANHRYPESEGLPDFRRAIAEWYEKRFEVTLDPDQEVLPLIGAKEGIGHIALCFIDPGDIALVPDPAYPVFSIGTMFAGGSSYYMPLTEENDFLPDLDRIPQDIARKAKMLWLNYPNNPTAAVAELDFFDRVVAFAQKHDLAVCHDGPYTEVAFDGYRPPSFMQTPGAKDVGVEFHSLSKSYNMTGWRVGMVVGNARAIDALRRVKSNLDSGIPQAIQHAAIEALRGPQDCIEDHNTLYQRRRDLLLKTLSQMGLKAKPPRAGLYIWARIPAGYTSLDFATTLLEEAGVVVIPGTGYGKYGEGYIRISLTVPDDRLEEAVARLSRWHASKGDKGS
ncbi:MAG: LL-diaminopimelate aminotransferase [Dehalococcoidia bacterium]|jgi:LL-diaminopimelate aminotransferase|nr:LL-diaminopimelate aminotransferase [Chloroflexota bacterium]MCK4242467.1 LL-diaminopimelate aminotransferase [Dehalococcoidia bacterium]